MPDIAEQILEATDILINERIKEISYDQTVIATIIDTSEAATKKKYRVSYNGTTMDVYSDITDYKETEQVRVLIPGGDWTQPKYIDGRYIPQAEDDSITSYLAVLDTVLDLSGNLANEGKEEELILEENNSIQATEKNKSEILLWENTNLNFIPGSLYDTWFIKLALNTTLPDTVISGEYGVRIEITFTSPTGDTFINSSTFSSNEMFGNPFYYELTSTQIKKFFISSSDTISIIRVYLYQNGNFKGLNSSLEAKPMITISQLYLAFGAEASKIVDNSIALYTNNSLIYNENIDNIQVGLLWYNKDNNGKFIGFSDSGPIDMFPEDNNHIIIPIDSDKNKIPEKYWVTNNVNGQTQNYTESLYRKITAEPKRFAKVIEENKNRSERERINEDVISLRLAADAIDLNTLVQQSMYEMQLINEHLDYIDKNIRKQVIPEPEKLDSNQEYSEEEQEEYNEAIEAYNKLENDFSEIIKLITQAPTTLQSLDLYNLYNNYLIEINKKLHDNSYTLYPDPEDKNRTYDVIISENHSKFFAAINNTKTAITSYNGLINSYIKNSEYESEYNRRFETILSSQSKLDNHYSVEFERLINSYTNPYNYKDIVQQTNLEDFQTLLNFDDINATTTYIESNLSSYDNRYSIVWYKEDKTVISDEFIPQGGWRQLDKFINYGLPNWLTQKDEITYLYEKRAMVKGNPPESQYETAMITLTQEDLASDQEVTRFKALVFFNHQMYASPVIEFKNGKPILETVITDDYTVSLEHDLNSQENYQVYNSNHVLVNAAAAYKQRRVRLNHNPRLGGNEGLTGAKITWTIPLVKTMLQFDIAEISGMRFTEGTHTEGYQQYYKTLPNENIENLDLSFPYHIKPFYSSTYTNNTINCTIEKTNGVVYDASITFIFSAYGNAGNAASLLVAPTLGAAAVTQKTPLKIQYKLFDYNGIEQDFTPSKDEDEINIIGEYEIEDNQISYKQNNENERTYYGVLTITDKTTNTTSYLPIGYSSNPNYYYEGPTTIIYDAQGHNPYFYKEQCKIYENAGAEADKEILNLKWYIKYYNKLSEEQRIPCILTDDNKLQVSNVYIKSDIRPVIEAYQNNQLIWAQSLYFDIASTSSSEQSSVTIGKAENADDTEDTIISAPINQVIPDENNTESGLVIGDIERTKKEQEGNSTSNKIFGIFGYTRGKNTYSFDSKGNFTLNGETIKVKNNKINYLELSDGALKTITDKEISLGGGVFNVSADKGAWINSDTYGQIDLKAIAEWVAKKMQQEN